MTTAQNEAELRLEPTLLSPLSIEELGQIPLFQEVAPSHLEKVAEVLTRLEAGAGVTLLEERERGNAILFLLSGSVKISVHTEEQSLILGFCGAGEMLGEVAVLDGLPRSARAVAQTSCIYAVVSRFDFWNTIWPIPPIPYNIACLLADRVRQLSNQMQTMANLDASSRLARQLVRLVEEHSQPQPGGHLLIPFNISQVELSQMVGATRVQINRTLSLWRGEGILSLKRGNIIVHDIKRLRFHAGIEDKALHKRNVPKNVIDAPIRAS